jgi:hypothetical protein
MSDAQVPPPYCGGSVPTGSRSSSVCRRAGHLVLVDGATELAPAALGIDVKLVTAGGGGGNRNSAADAEQIYAPGSILRCGGPVAPGGPRHARFVGDLLRELDVARAAGRVAGAGDRAVSVAARSPFC